MIQLTNKLSNSECKDLIDWFNCQNKMQISQNHESIMFTIDDVCDVHIKSLINRKVNEVNNGFKLSWMTFARIGIGGSLIKHKDMVPSGDINNGAKLSNQISTAVFYLNSDFIGGEFISDGFPSIKPELGMVIIFDGCNISHQVNVVSAGHRYTLTAWSI